MSFRFQRYKPAGRLHMAEGDVQGLTTLPTV